MYIFTHISNSYITYILKVYSANYKIPSGPVVVAGLEVPFTGGTATSGCKQNRYGSKITLTISRSIFISINMDRDTNTLRARFCMG